MGHAVAQAVVGKPGKGGYMHSQGMAFETLVTRTSIHSGSWTLCVQLLMIGHRAPTVGTVLRVSNIPRWLAIIPDFRNPLGTLAAIRRIHRTLIDCNTAPKHAEEM